MTSTVTPYILIDAEALKSKGVGIYKYGQATDICGLEFCSDYPGGKEAFVNYMLNYLTPSEPIPTRFGFDDVMTTIGDDDLRRIVDDDIMAIINENVDTINDDYFGNIIDDILSDGKINENDSDKLFDAVDEMRYQSDLLSTLLNLLDYLDKTRSSDFPAGVDKEQVMQIISEIRADVLKAIPVYFDAKKTLREITKQNDYSGTELLSIIHATDTNIDAAKPLAEKIVKNIDKLFLEMKASQLDNEFFDDFKKSDSDVVIRNGTSETAHAPE